MADITIRIAEHSDSINIWEWRNDSETRRNSRSEDEITWEEHCAWFAKSLLNESRRILIGFNTDLGDAIGMVRFDLDTDGDSADVSINLDPKHRGRRLSKTMLSSAIDIYSKDFVCVLNAEIYDHNISSIKCFEHCGFSVYERNGKLLRLKNTNLVINAIEQIRARNNVNWMDLVRLAFRVAPKEAEDIFRKVNSDDGEISRLLKRLT